MVVCFALHQNEPDPSLFLATQKGKIAPSCPLRTTQCVPHDQAFSVKMAEYWPLSFSVHLWIATPSRSITRIKEVDQYQVVLYRSFSLSRSKKINRKPFSGLSQEIVMLLKINKQDTSPSFRSVHSPKPQIFGKMFRRNLQSSVWKRHVGAHQMCTNMAAGI